MTRPLILFDGNSVLHEADHSTPLTVGGHPVQAVFVTLKSIRSMVNEFPGHDLAYLWDGRAQFRLDLFPEYKGNRKVDPTPENLAAKAAFKRQQQLVEHAVAALGIRQLRCRSLEADDLGYHLTEMFSDRPIVVRTGDRDWLQFVKKGVSWHNGTKLVTANTFTEATGYLTVKGFVEGKAIQGDASDNIPGIGGMGKGRAQEFINLYGSYKAFFDAALAGELRNAKGGNPKWVLQATSEEAWAAFHRNLQLMDLSRAPKPNPDDMILTPAAFNEDRFKLICQQLAFRSILASWEQFIGPFRALALPELKEAA